MGRFSFSLFFVAATGCGIDARPEGTDPVDQNDAVDDVIGGETELVDNAVPQVISCGMTQLSADVAHGMSIASSPNGTKLFGLQDGSIVARGLDHGGMSNTPYKLRSGVTNASAAYANNSLFVASTSGDDALYIDVVDPQLDKFVPLAKVEGNGFAHTPIVTAPNAYLVPSFDDLGLHIAGFDGRFNQTDAKLFEQNKPVNAIAASNFGPGGALLAWSTTDECHLAFMSTAWNGEGTMLPHACNNVQLAADANGGTAVLVWETPEGVMISHAQHTHLQPAVMLRRDAFAPKVVFDGSQYWVSYLDMRGQVVVGFLDASYHAVTTAMPGMTPDHDAFELAVVAGNPYVISGEDRIGYTAHRVCTR